MVAAWAAQGALAAVVVPYARAGRLQVTRRLGHLICAAALGYSHVEELVQVEA